MRRATRRDANHATIVAELRTLGYAVSDLSLAGSGCPDLAVSKAGRMLLVEVKNPATRPTKPRGATNEAKLIRQAVWRALHPGCVLTVTSAAEVDAAWPTPHALRAEGGCSTGSEATESSEVP